jgi:hypothetical protein
LEVLLMLLVLVLVLLVLVLIVDVVGVAGLATAAGSLELGVDIKVVEREVDDCASEGFESFGRAGIEPVIFGLLSLSCTSTRNGVFSMYSANSR